MKRSVTAARATILVAIAIAVGSQTACAIRASGDVVCWGNDANGGLGDGPGDSSSATPVLVAPF